MTQIVIDKKKYVPIVEKDYRVLQRKAALNRQPEKILSLNKQKPIRRK